MTSKMLNGLNPFRASAASLLRVYRGHQQNDTSEILREDASLRHRYVENINDIKKGEWRFASFAPLRVGLADVTAIRASHQEGL